jgi:isoleucyl-tRNA synthetase
MVDIRISAKEGYDAQKDANNFIILNTTLTSDLVNEGIARELISKVQNLRKQKDFDVADRIKLYYEADDAFDKVIDSFEDMIKKETLSIELIKKNDLTLEFDLNGLNVKLDVERA